MPGCDRPVSCHPEMQLIKSLPLRAGTSAGCCPQVLYWQYGPVSRIAQASHHSLTIPICSAPSPKRSSTSEHRLADGVHNLYGWGHFPSKLATPRGQRQTSLREMVQHSDCTSRWRESRSRLIGPNSSTSRRDYRSPWSSSSRNELTASFSAVLRSVRRSLLAAPGGHYSNNRSGLTPSRSLCVVDISQPCRRLQPPRRRQLTR
jgi:hypothetical protein